VVTDLISVVSGVAPETIRDAVPPGCRREPEPAPRPRDEGGDVVLEFDPWRPRRPARHLLPSLSVLSPASTTFRFELSGRVNGAWTPWVATATLGGKSFAPLPASAGPLAVDVDVCEASVPLETVRLRLRMHREDAEAALSAPWLLTLSACDLDASPPAVPRAGRDRPGASPARGPALDVPSRSQMLEDAGIAQRICSPTSVSMVLAYLGLEDSTARVAADVLHRALDRYGVWPAAIAAAGRRGALGYLLRVPDWSAAAWCLTRGLPVIASVRYARDGLRGAPMPETTGHLLVITGQDGDEVLVSDPAAPDLASVRRRYALTDLTRAWLATSGVAYILFRP
jgi:hypothetical protein